MMEFISDNIIAYTFGVFSGIFGFMFSWDMIWRTQLKKMNKTNKKK